MNVDRLIQDGESETVEFKESWSDDALKALAALANTQGGTLLLGVADDKRIPGWQGSGKDQEVIANRIVDGLHLHPIKLATETHNGSPVLVVQMARAAAPVPIRGVYYRRVGNSTRDVHPEELHRFLLERTGQSWDALPGEFDLEDLNEETVRQFKGLARERLPQMSDEDDTASLMRKLKLVREDGRLCRAALMLFGHDPQRHFPSTYVQIGRFKDESIIIDDKQLNGNIFEMVLQAQQAFLQYLQVRYTFDSEARLKAGLDPFQRGEIWDYPLSSLREAVINAILHRDYTSTARVMIRVYDRSVMITNPGGLPPEMTVADLYQTPHDSRPRNPFIAQVLYYANYIEKWGSGTTRIVKECRAHGLPEPEYQSKSHDFMITFRMDRYTRENLKARGLNERQIQAVLHVQSEGSVSNSEYKGMLGIIERTARRDLKELEDLGFLRKTEATGRSTRYILAIR